MLRNDGGLAGELDAVRQITAHMHRVAPALAADEEARSAIRLRIERAINADAIYAYLSNAHSASERVERLLRLSDLAPSAGTKQVVGQYLRATFSIDDIVREHAGKSATRAAAVAPLAEQYTRIARAGVDASTKRDIIDALDTMLYEIIRADIISARSMPYGARIMLLLRTCVGVPLPPDGRAFTLARSAVAQAIRRPEFLQSYLSRFKGEGERAEAIRRLRDLLARSGLAGR